MDRKLNYEIRDLQSKLNNELQQDSLHDGKTIKLSNEIDKLINHYYSLSSGVIKFPTNSKMNLFFEESYRELIKITKENKKFPELEEWNKYAKENNLLSTESMKYIIGVEWKYIRLKVNKEIKKNK